MAELAETPTADLHAGYQASITSTDLGALISFLDDVNRDPTMRAYKEHMRHWLALKPGESMLEVGCGAGHDLLRDAEQVGAEGRAVGIDAKPSMIAETRRRTAAHPSVACAVGDARALPVADASVDATRADRTLMYVPQPAHAVAEMARILRPGGRFVAMELDYGAVLIDHPDEAFTERVLDAVRRSFPAPWLGRRLRGMLAELGMAEATSTIYGINLPHHLFQQIVYPTVRSAVAAGELAADQTDAWLDHLTRAADAGRGYNCFTAVVTHAVKPG